MTNEFYFEDDNLIDMQTLADAIKTATGLPVLLTPTGGNVCTIYVGEPDVDGYYPFAAGPGTTYPDGTQFAFTSDFYWGMDGGEDGGSSSVYDTQDDVLRKIIDWITNNVAPEVTA